MVERETSQRKFGGLAWIAAFFCVVFPTVAGAEELKGVPKIVDGDTIEVDGRVVHLRGIDAPEKDQKCASRKGNQYDCGLQSVRYLSGLLRRQTVVCRGDERDQDGNLIATCSIGWLNVNEQIVIDGWAIADRAREPVYVRGEHAAKARNDGLWRGTFMPPWEWRENHGKSTN